MTPCITAVAPALEALGGWKTLDDARAAIRRIVGAYAQISVGLDSLQDRDDLYDLGMTSHATVNVMLALEDAFDIEFPEELLAKETFESVAAMEAVVCGLMAPA